MDAKDRSEFVEISLHAPKEAHRKIWRQLPEDMRKEVAEVWGTDAMYVKKNQVDLLFGYHNYTLTNMWKMDPADRKWFQKTFVYMTEMVFGKKAAMRVGQGEELMTALANTVKDIIVIKTGLVTLGNMVSNVMLLRVMGVGFEEIFKGHAESWVAMRKYKRDAQAAAIIQTRLNNSRLTSEEREELESDLVRLEDRMANSPVVNLIDAGLLSTIVEDVDTEANQYQLTKRMQRRLADKSWYEAAEEKFERLPKSLKAVAKEVLLTKDSGLYSFLNEAAQFSDFGARYVLFKKLVEKDGMSKRQAAGEVMDIFIDYDLPTHQGLQYLNNIGLLMFSKYLIRVQKIIFKMFSEHFGNAMASILLQNLFIDVSDIGDSLMFAQTNPMTRLANPIESFFDVAPDILTFKPFM